MIAAISARVGQRACEPGHDDAQGDQQADECERAFEAQRPAGAQAAKEHRDAQQLWSRHDVTDEPVRAKCFQHPAAGFLEFTVAHVYAGSRSEITVSTYTPADEATAAKLPLAFD